MKYFIAILTAAILIALIFWFIFHMRWQVKEWEAANADLNSIQIGLLHLAELLTGYWYFFALAIIGGSLGIAAIIPSSKK